MDNKTNIKTIRRRRSECSWKRASSPELEMIDYPPGPINIVASWNPVNRAEKPPYSYATIIGHAILTSKERKLTLHDIYVWITENYPFYSNDTQGWQNSIRHNLSLHKSFVKIDRDPNSQNPPRKGCFWTIRPGKEKYFIDNLQRNPVRKQQSLSHLAKRQQISRRSSAIYDSKSICKGPLRTTTTSSESSSLSGSPTYHLLHNVPETSMSYNVYPEHTAELFGDMNYSSSHPPSLSPCDAYSTTSSYAENHFVYNTSPDYQPTSADYSHLSYPTNFMDSHSIINWSNSTQKIDSFLQPMIKQEHYNTDSPPSSLYLQQARNDHSLHYGLFHR